nr:zinc finger, CCHC-type [Ipomoea trifida]
MEQFHEIVRILGQIRHHGMNMDDSIAIASIIDKLPPSWNKVLPSTLLMKANHMGTAKGKGNREMPQNLLSLRRMEKGKERHGLNAGCATVHTLKKDCEVWKEKMQGISSGDHGQGSGQWKQGKIFNLVSDSTENFIAMISEVYVMQTDDSWWVDTGATRHVCKDMNLYKSYKNLEDGPNLYMGNDSMVKMSRQSLCKLPILERCEL